MGGCQFFAFAQLSEPSTSILRLLRPFEAFLPDNSISGDGSVKLGLPWPGENLQSGYI